MNLRSILIAIVALGWVALPDAKAVDGIATVSASATVRMQVLSTAKLTGEGPSLRSTQSATASGSISCAQNKSQYATYNAGRADAAALAPQLQDVCHPLATAETATTELLLIP